MKIRALSVDTGGCHFYRIRTPLTAGRRAYGWDVDWGTSVTEDDLNTSDVLVAQFLNGPADLEGWLRIVDAPRRPALIYEVDDDLFTIDRVVTPEVSGGKPVLWGNPDTQARLRQFIASVDLVTVTTSYLAELYSAEGARRVAVLPNAVPDWMLDVPRPAQADRPLTVGWTLSHSHLLDAREHVDALDTYFSARGCTSVFGWYGPGNISGGFPRQYMVPWCGDVNEYLISMYGELDVGIAPLATANGVFNRGKSGIKADEYAAWGVPAVVSDFPQYSNVVHGSTGFVIRHPSMWRKYLTVLEDPVLRNRMGMDAREAVSSRTISKVIHLWRDAYQEAIDVRRA